MHISSRCSAHFRAEIYGWCRSQDTVRSKWSHGGWHEPHVRHPIIIIKRRESKNSKACSAHSKRKSIETLKSNTHIIPPRDTKGLIRGAVSWITSMAGISSSSPAFRMSISTPLVTLWFPSRHRENATPTIQILPKLNISNIGIRYIYSSWRVPRYTLPSSPEPSLPNPSISPHTPLHLPPTTGSDVEAISTVRSTSDVAMKWPSMGNYYHRNAFPLYVHHFYIWVIQI